MENCWTAPNTASISVETPVRGFYNANSSPLLKSHMNTLCWQQLELFIKQQNIADKPLWVALSGGVDSVCLLHLAKELKAHTGIEVQAIHVNHGLSVNADNWQRTVSALCDSWGIELSCHRVHIEQKTRTSLEQQARDARYQAIAARLPEGAVLLTGHHQADQFETFILRLMRSSGLTGLSAMKVLADLPNDEAKAKHIKLARPLLNTPKAEVLTYAQDHELTWVEDESNQDQSFDRNFVRANLLPMFLQRWPNAAKSVAVSTRLLEQESALLQEYLEQDLALLVEQGFGNMTCLNLAKLTELSKNKQASLVRLFVHRASNQILSRTAIEELLTNMVNSRKDSQPELKLTKSVSLNVYNEQLYLVNTSHFVAKTFELKSGEEVLFNQHRLYQKLKVSSERHRDFIIKFDVMADKLQPNKGSGSKKVKALLKAAKCPPWLRGEIPLIYLENQLIAVGNLVIDKDFAEQLIIELA